MNKIITTVFVVLITIMPLKLFAHANHGSFKPISSEEATEIASGLVQNLINNDSLGASWTAVTPNQTSKKETEAGSVWIVTFENSLEEDSSKRSLFVFLDEFGNPIAASHKNELE